MCAFLTLDCWLDRFSLRSCQGGRRGLDLGRHVRLTQAREVSATVPMKLLYIVCVVPSTYTTVVVNCVLWSSLQEARRYIQMRRTLAASDIGRGRGGGG